MMKRRNLFWRMLVMALTLVLAVVGCATIEVGELTDIAGPNETALYFNRPSNLLGSAGIWIVYVDGVERVQLPNGSRGRVIVPYGEHILTGGIVDNDANNVSGNVGEYKFNANSPEMRFNVSYKVTNPEQDTLAGSISGGKRFILEWIFKEVK